MGPTGETKIALPMTDTAGELATGVPSIKTTFPGEQNDSNNDTECILCHQFHTLGISKVMHIGKTRIKMLRFALKTHSVVQHHKGIGKPSNHTINEDQASDLKVHLECLLQLSEVWATQVTAILVDGEQGHANRDAVSVDMVYLPSSFGFCLCYKQYMEGLEYDVVCHPNGGVIVHSIDGEDINFNEFVSFATYCQFWKNHYPQLKVSSPGEDMCQYCFTFANCHHYLAK
jgi:hypothetical protein